LISVAFFTLVEQKILRYTQNRVGPNKFSVLGVLQPLLDGVKLVFKENLPSFKRNFFTLIYTSIMFFLIIVLIWFIVPTFLNNSITKYSSFIFLILLGISSYVILLTGLIRKSKFAIIGSLRASAQTISYEIRLAFILLSPLLLWQNISFKSTFFFLNPSLFLFLLWWISCITECNRAPFDFAEGERELIRGFNVEYSRRNFIFIFLGEYGIILGFSLLTTTIIFSSSLIIFILLISSFLIIRRTFPRFRYDILIKLCWLSVLPLRIAFLFFFIIIK